MSAVGLRRWFPFWALKASGLAYRWPGSFIVAEAAIVPLLA